MDLVEEVKCAVESTAVYHSLTFHGNVFLSFGQKKPVVSLDHVVVVRIGRTDQDGTFKKP